VNWLWRINLFTSSFLIKVEVISALDKSDEPPAINGLFALTENLMAVEIRMRSKDAGSSAA
jgi:hypothetical protein